MRWNELQNQQCSVARAISVIGDRWTLLILRDCFMRIRRFEDFQVRLGIARRVLSERLDKLVDKGVLERVAYQERPQRFEYRLTKMGLDLYPVIMSLVQWGDKYLAEDRGPPVLHRHLDCGKDFKPVMTCSKCGEPLDPKHVQARPGPGTDHPEKLFGSKDG